MGGGRRRMASVRKPDNLAGGRRLVGNLTYIPRFTVRFAVGVAVRFPATCEVYCETLASCEVNEFSSEVSAHFLRPHPHPKPHSKPHRTSLTTQPLLREAAQDSVRENRPAAT